MTSDPRGLFSTEEMKEEVQKTNHYHTLYLNTASHHAKKSQIPHRKKHDCRKNTLKRRKVRTPRGHKTRQRINSCSLTGQESTEDVFRSVQTPRSTPGYKHSPCSGPRHNAYGGVPRPNTCRQNIMPALKWTYLGPQRDPRPRIFFKLVTRKTRFA